MSFEYRVIPAPLRVEKAAGAKTGAKSGAERYALALTAELNRMAAEGWDYVRADVLPSEERSGLTGRMTVYHNLLVFRRALARPAPVAGAASGVAAPMPEYPVTASPAQLPEPVPHLPEAASPAPDPLAAIPPAPRIPPER